MKTEERKAKGLPVDEERPRTRKEATPSVNGEATDEKPQRNGGGGGYQGRRNGSEKFNAFREMERMRKGFPVNLAPIPDTVAIVGKAMAVSTDSLKRRRDDRDRDGDDKRQKVSRNEVSIAVLLGTYSKG